MDIEGMCEKLCNAERDRLTIAEIGIDEALTIMDRHRVPRNDPTYLALKSASRTLHRALTAADGFHVRHSRLSRLRDSMTDMLPMSDRDLGMQ